MRYRKLDPAGDYTFGHSQTDFLVDSPEAVAQAILTRLNLSTGEWFLNTSDGTPMDQILGTGHQTTFDQAIKDRILNTPGVIGITSYFSTIDSVVRSIRISATVDTLYGVATVTSNQGF